MSYDKLRDMHQGDLETVLLWRNREEVRNNMYTNHVISMDEHLAWWTRESNNPQTKLLVFESAEGVSQGVVIFTKYTGEAGLATWAFYSGDVTIRGLGQKMEKAALEYAFETLKIRKLECEVLSFNKRVVDFHRKNGFEIEGVFKDQYHRDGQMFDIYRLAMHSNAWFSKVKPALELRRTGPLAGKTYKQVMRVSANDIDEFARLSGDSNPIHLCDEAAQELGFERRIAHGVLTLSFISSIFGTKFPSNNCIYLSQSIEFLKPIYCDSEIEIELKVLSNIGRRIVIGTEVSVAGVLCISGEAVLLLSKNHIEEHS